jgi:hypothetical protein
MIYSYAYQPAFPVHAVAIMQNARRPIAENIFDNAEINELRSFSTMRDAKRRCERFELLPLIRRG